MQTLRCAGPLPGRKSSVSFAERGGLVTVGTADPRAFTRGPGRPQELAVATIVASRSREGMPARCRGYPGARGDRALWCLAPRLLSHVERRGRRDLETSPPSGTSRRLRCARRSISSSSSVKTADGSVSNGAGGASRMPRSCSGRFPRPLLRPLKGPQVEPVGPASAGSASAALDAPRCSS